MRHVLQRGCGEVRSCAFSQDSKLLGTVRDLKNVVLYDVQTWRVVRVMKGHEDKIKSVRFSHDGVHLVSASYDKTVRVWDVYSGRCTSVLRGHTHYVCQAEFSPDDRVIASGACDNTVRLWWCRSEEEHHEWELIEWRTAFQQRLSTPSDQVDCAVLVGHADYVYCVVCPKILDTLCPSVSVVNCDCSLSPRMAS